ncbi:TSUP family transporter, partial [Burkholderia stabilis]
QRLLVALFALTMLVVAGRLLRQALRNAPVDADASPLCVGRVNPDTGRLVWSWPVGLTLASTGAVTGLMTGLLGVGGGFVIVPMLRKFTNVSMHGVVATSLMVIALVGTGGVFATLVSGTRAPLDVTLWFAVATAFGMAAGRGASRYLAARHVQAGFAAVLVCVALGLLAKAVFGG